VLGILTHNLGWKLLSLAAAFAIWMSVASEPELATLSTVPVEYKGVPDDLEISSEVRENVTLETRGPVGRLRDMPDARSAVVLDFSAVQQAGIKTFDIDAHNVTLPRGIALVRVIPAQLTFTFERRLPREVPVEVRLAGPHQGYAVVSAEAFPPKLRIVGPESAVRRTQSLATDPVDISGVVSDAQYRVNTYLPERLVRFQGSSYVTVRVVVKKK
jgi:YbbR domain-containing protein